MLFISLIGDMLIFDTNPFANIRQKFVIATGLLGHRYRNVVAVAI